MSRGGAIDLRKGAATRVQRGLVITALAISVLPVRIDASAQTPATPKNSSRTASDTTEGPERLKHDTRITIGTNATPITAGTNTVPPKEKSFQFKSTWKGWDGLHTEIVQKTPLNLPTARWRTTLQGTNAVPVIHLEEMKMSGKIGAKFAFDGAGFVTSKELDDFDSGIELRRARIYGKGDCLLLLPVSYQLEVGYIPNEFYIEESYLEFRDIHYIGNLRFGQYQAPMGLDVVTSSRDISFMEPASPVATLAPGVNAGVQIGKPIIHKRATWALGMFANGVGNDFGDASKDFARVITRLTGLPIYEPDPEHPGSARFLHVGLSANVLYSGSSTVRYRSRPESHLAPYVIDTGDIESQGALVVGTEAAWVNGPLSLQAEALHSFVDQAEGERLDFNGFYTSAGWFITGENRPYSQTEGRFTRVIPNHDFNWGKGGWGAWELVGRYSFVDLNSGEIHGGRLGLLSAGLNWYLHSHVKWRFEYGAGRVQGRSPEGRMNIFQTRVEVDF